MRLRSFIWRERTGDLTSADETIEFDISGPKGKATVRVITTGAIAPPGGHTLSLAKKITVKFSDDSEIEVPSLLSLRLLKVPLPVPAPRPKL